MTNQTRKKKGGFRELDCFAKQVQFTFKGEDSYSTKAGGIISIICFAVVVLLVVVQTMELLGRTEPELNMVESESDYGFIDLHDLGFTFAMEKIDKRIGKIEVVHVKYDVEGKLPEKEIQMVDCASLLQGGDPRNRMTGYVHNKAFNPYRAHARLQQDFLCPNTTTLPSKGLFGPIDDDFIYTELRLTRCDESDLINEPNGIDNEERPLNKCFEDKDLHRTIIVALMNSHVDFS